ncbi:ABC transporter G family member 20-like [Oppia nitens]|uniref:ABC transporter G family member 20-like n=1 Tax=Oppia nitens TaxID=1686743 RepID=UPI0023DC06DD|nr:ABC transporter G family member 20-like [Oppia nitens]
MTSNNNLVIDKQNALEIRDVSFYYKSGHNILNGINLTVPKAGIYGLLGSSGCGKTTLLRCALGRLKPKYGSISLFGRTPGTPGSRVPGPAVGYMPQELALYEDFSIEETLRYFGRLFGITSQTIQTRIEFMLDLLQLPNGRKMIRNLSGGQKRRVSIATALLHSPPLLILDEPTVGVDLILRDSIWKHLEYLCKRGFTVILTTHYIEEARNASKVGFMRSGKLLAEDSPKQLIANYKLTTLENVFLKLSQLEDQMKANNQLTFKGRSVPKEIENNICNTESSSDIQLNVINKQSMNENQMTTNCYVNKGYTEETISIIETTNETTLKTVDNTNGTVHMKQQSIVNETKFIQRLTALTLKNFRQMTRNMALLAFFVLLPTIEISLMIMSIGNDIKNMKVSVYNPDNVDNQTLSLSELFLSAIDVDHIIIVRYPTLESAVQAVRDNDVWAVIHFEHNFTETLRMRSLLSSDSDPGIIKDSSIKLQLDMSNQVIGFQIQRHIYTAFAKFLGFLAINYGINPDALKPPIVVGPPIYGVKNQSLITFIAPGALIMVAYFSTTVMTTHLLIKERNDGLAERSLVAGVSPFEFVLSHIILQTILLAIQVGLKLMVAFLVFTIPNRGSIMSAIALTFLQGLCGLMFGLMISGVCYDEIYANTLGIGTFFPSVMIGGIFWPLQSMPTWLRYFSQALPSTLAIESLRSILLRGWGFERLPVLMGFIVTILWLIFFLINSIIFFKKKL